VGGDVRGIEPAKRRWSPWPGLFWFAGGRRAVLRHAPSELPFYNGLGLAVILTGLVSGATLSFAISLVLDEPIKHLWPLFLVWAVFIVNVDRLMMMSLHSRRQIAGIIPRVIFTVVIGVQVAEAVVLPLFQPEIAQQLTTTQFNDLRERQTTITHFYNPRIVADQQGIDSVQQQENAIIQHRDHDTYISNCEAKEKACSLTHELGCGPVCQHYAQLASAEQAELNDVAPRDNAEITQLELDVKSLTTAENKQIATAQSTTAHDAGLLARETALAQVIKAHPGVGLIVWLIRAALVLADLLPLTFKIMHLRKDSPYEQVWSALRRRECLAAHRIDRRTEVKKARIDGKARADQQVDEVVIDVDHDIRINEQENRVPWGAATGSRAGRPAHQPPVDALSLSSFVSNMQGHGSHESMPVPVPRTLAIAGWTGTGLLVALGCGLTLLGLDSHHWPPAEIPAAFLATASVSLMVFTRGFRSAPAWAQQASFVTLLAGLALPLMAVVTGL
jgi:hypothetical protein